MKKTFKLEHFEEHLPPRCRKIRKRLVMTDFTAEIKEVSDAEAPVAIIERAKYLFLYPDHLGERRNGCRYRWFDNRLWLRVRLSDTYCLHGKRDRFAVVSNLPEPSGHICSFAISHADMTQIVADWGNKYLLVDGLLYRCVGEPRYVIHTMGLGCNHGGTCVSTHHYYNGNIGKNRYFRIDQAEEARAEGERIANARGDTKNVPMKLDSRFEILIPDAIRCNPKAEHGDGDEFINNVESIIENVQNPGAAAVMGMALAFLG